MIDWNKIKIRISDGYVYLNGINFESQIGMICHSLDTTVKPYRQVHFIHFTIFRTNVQTINESKEILIESLKNFISNLGIKTINDNLSESIKWIAESGMITGYINSYRIFITNQIAPLNYFYETCADFETSRVFDLDGYEKEIAKSIDKFIEKVLIPAKSGKETIM